MKKIFFIIIWIVVVITLLGVIVLRTRLILDKIESDTSVTDTESETSTDTEKKGITVLGDNTETGWGPLIRPN